MYQNISFYDFTDAFSDQYKNNFSYEGKKALFEYLENYEDETGEKIELDTVALCCEYTEYENVEEYLKDHSTKIDIADFEFYEDKEDIEEEFEKAVVEEIQENTQYIPIENSDAFIIQQF